MNRENASFLLGGIFFGFLVGFSVSYYVYHQGAGQGPSSAGMQAPVNPSDPMGTGSAGAPPAGVSSGGAGQEAPSMETMQRVQSEIAALRKAIEANPKDARSLGRLGDLYYDAGMYDKARDYYTQSLQNDPKNPNTSTDLGICLQRLGKPDEALAQFRRSLEIDPRHWQSWLNVGIVSLFDKNDVKTAEEAFAKVREINPSFEGLPQIQQALEQAKSSRK
ncbi:MAG TPA: tetratricopeptide repeat protein [Candidatus Polarisedimenticolia bacterium]|nr:tetratricopeptide repeat protein [Candidatus Polarisedimenticolia bacterium]